MNKNDIITLKIEDMGIDGEGIGKIDGMTFFVKDAVIGDEIEARITKLKKNYGYARVEQILKSSEFRTEPKCELHRRCGGCQIQAMDYAKQLEFKENKVKNNLVRLGGFDADFVDSVMEPIVGMENPYRYRNKAQFPIGKDKEGNIIAGFYASRTHSIIPVKDCMLGVAENREILDAILSYMRECHIEPYDETTGRGLVRHALIRYGFTTKEIMVCFVVNKDKADKSGEWFPHQKELVEELAKIENREPFVLKPFSPHCFRHTFVTRCRMNSVPYETIQPYVGHSNKEMTEHYNHEKIQMDVEALKKVSFL